MTEEEGREDVPGDFLGDYKVEAALLESTCGAGTLAAPGLWDFEVKLSRDEGHLYWSNGAEAIQGKLSSDGSTFGFTSEVPTTIREAKPGRPGCVVWRQDAASGELELGSGETDVPAFEGTLIYSYAQGVGSDCSEDLDASGLTQLPCVIRYGMKGKRIE